MSSSSIRYGFALPETTRVALEIFEGAGGTQRAVGYPKNSINLGSGNPAFITPEHIRKAAKHAIDAGKTHYERNRDLKVAITEKLARDNGVGVDPDTGVLVTPGAHLALFDTFRAYVAPGDEVILASPGSYFLSNTLANGGIPVEVPLHKARGFKLDPEEVASRITPRSKILALTSPEAPTASVQERQDLEKLADLAIQHNLLVVSDELYEAIIFGPTPHTSIGALPGMAERTITINGLSKGWAMTGWRVGYAAGDPRVMKPVMAINHLNCISLNSVAQFAALEALTGPQDFLAEALEVYRVRRDLLVAGVRAIDGLDCLMPEGTYYCWVDIRNLKISSQAFQQHCLLEHGLAFNAGTTFGKEGEGYIRLSCSPSEAEIRDGLARLEQAVAGLESRRSTR